KPRPEGRVPAEGADQARCQLLPAGPQDECCRRDSQRRKCQKRSRPEESQARFQPGKEPVGVEELLAPVKNALLQMRSAEFGMRNTWTVGGHPFRIPKSAIRILQQRLAAGHLHKRVIFAFAERLVESLLERDTDRCGIVSAVKLLQEKVFLLAKLKIRI